MISFESQIINRTLFRWDDGISVPCVWKRGESAL